MLYYVRVDISAGIDVNETSASKECGICCCWYFLDKKFKFQRNAWNDLWMKNIAILNIQGVDYCCIIILTGKSKAINLL